MHQGGDAEDEEQGGRGENLADVGGRDVAEDRTREVATADHDDRDRPKDRERVSPAGKAGQHRVAGVRCEVAAGCKERQQGEQRNDGEVLEEEDAETRPTDGAAAEAALVEHAKHDRGRGEGEDGAGDDGGAPGQAGRPRDGEDDQAAGGELGGAQAEDAATELPEQGGLELEADEEEQNDHAEIGQAHHVGTGADEVQHMRTDDDAGDQIAEQGAEARTPGERNREDAGGEVDQDGHHRGAMAPTRCCSRAR